MYIRGKYYFYEYCTGFFFYVYEKVVLQFILEAGAGEDTGLGIRGVQELDGTINNLPIVLILSILSRLVLLLKGLAPWSDIGRCHRRSRRLLRNSSSSVGSITISGISGGIVGGGDELHVGVCEIRHEVDTLAAEDRVGRLVIDLCEAFDIVVLDEGVLVLGSTNKGGVGKDEAAEDLGVSFDLELAQEDFVEVVFVCCFLCLCVVLIESWLSKERRRRVSVSTRCFVF